jgi:Immunity protein 10
MTPELTYALGVATSTVDEVYVGDLDGLFTLAFRGSSDDEALVFQLATRVGEQDAMLGLDSYSISTGSGDTVYGGVTRACLRDSVLTLTLDRDAAASLGLDHNVAFALPGHDAVERAAVALKRLGIMAQRG